MVLVTSSVQSRIYSINKFLSNLSAIRNLALNLHPDKLFETECFLLTANRLVNRNKQPFAVNQQNGFRPLYNPGNPLNYSYLRFIDRDNQGVDLYLSMNAQVPGSTGVLHSPDIVLTHNSVDGPVHSIYECKNYSNRLGIGVYREFIGFLKELGLNIWGSRSKNMFRAMPDMSPRIYTSAIASVVHQQMAQDKYGFSVEDRL